MPLKNNAEGIFARFPNNNKELFLSVNFLDNVCIFLSYLLIL